MLQMMQYREIINKCQRTVNAVKYLIPSYTIVRLLMWIMEVSQQILLVVLPETSRVEPSITVHEEETIIPRIQLRSVNGQTYAGGFGGNVYSGALADAGGESAFWAESQV